MHGIFYPVYVLCALHTIRLTVTFYPFIPFLRVGESAVGWLRVQDTTWRIDRVALAATNTVFDLPSTYKKGVRFAVCVDFRCPASMFEHA